MADGNNLRCFNADCNCDCQKAPKVMSHAFRKRRLRNDNAITGSTGIAQAKEDAVKAAIEQPGDTGSGP